MNINLITNRPQIKNSIVLVTGGAGFIGSHLVDALIVEGVREVVVIDNLFTGQVSNLHDALQKGKVTLYKDDAEILTSLEYIFDKHKIDIVFNCATKALNYSFINPANSFLTNINVLLNLLELQRKKNFKTLCHFSTSEVYGTAKYEPMDESHPKNPTTTYAAGKSAADDLLNSYVSMFNLDAYIVRPFNNFGPRQNYIGILAAVIPITAMRILNNLQPKIFGDGTQSRDFIYVLDTVKAILKLHKYLPKGESINISSNNQISISSLVQKISTYLEYTDKPIYSEARSSDVFCHIGDNTKIQKIIDWETTSFEEALIATLNWYRREFNLNLKVN